mmetsp:Transcript_10388/g.14663  ORF Transcript_10388/g.14663 Transcript_10388/m.14663 type:complete len:557 (+) Transcript_10388:218-1888(+)
MILLGSNSVKQLFHRAVVSRRNTVLSLCAEFPSTISNGIGHKESNLLQHDSRLIHTTMQLKDDNDNVHGDDNGLHPILKEARTCSTSDHLQSDCTHLWHPYTSLVSPTPVLPVRSADGVKITLETGDVLLDGMSSWWAVIHGYNSTELNNAMEEQLSKMSHVMFGGFTHRPAVELAKLLIHITPPALEKVFLVDSGSVAVEVALKMAIQYWRGGKGRGIEGGKNKICSVRGGYHGDTLGAMSVCDPDTGMHSTLFPPEQETMLPRQVFVSRPPCDLRKRIGDSLAGCQRCICNNTISGNEEALEASLDNMQKTLAEQHESLAALILEPIVQGAGGMRFYPSKYLKRARELCDEYNLLLICDEIATGFGRSGNDTLFACEHAGVTPDILCLGKALTGGYMTLGAVLATTKVAEKVSASDNDGVALPLMHGPTFMGNPLACAVAVASTNKLLRMDPTSGVPFWKSRINAIEGYLQKGLAEVHCIPGVADVRVGGAIGVIEMKEPLDGAKVTQRCVDFGVWLRPFGRLLYTMPPYVMSEKEVLQVTGAMVKLAEEASKD